MPKPKKRFVGRVHLGHGKYQWVGRFHTRKERDLAVAKARVELQKRRNVENLTVGEWVDRFLARYERTHKDSSYLTAQWALKAVKKEWGSRPLLSITRLEAMDWVEKAPPSKVPMVVTLFNSAVDAELLDRNPFRGLGRRGRGRSDHSPPTAEEFDRLVDACSAHGWYAPQMRALLVFAAYSGLRPGELFELEWQDVDFEAMRIDVRRRLYKGRVDLPKSNKVRRIALTPPARDALLGLPTRPEGRLVFLSKRRKRLSQPTLSGYWGKVTARAKLDFDFYLATKHYCVHYLYATLSLPRRSIAEQMGWSVGAVDELLAVYGHGNIGALEEIDRAFTANVVQLRDASETHEGSQGA